MAERCGFLPHNEQILRINIGKIVNQEFLSDAHRGALLDISTHTIYNLETFVKGLVLLLIINITL